MSASPGATVRIASAVNYVPFFPKMLMRRVGMGPMVVEDCREVQIRGMQQAAALLRGTQLFVGPGGPCHAMFPLPAPATPTPQVTAQEPIRYSSVKFWTV